MFLFRGLNESRYRHHNRFEIREKGRPNSAPKAPPPSSAKGVMTNGHLTELLDLVAGPVQWG